MNPINIGITKGGSAIWLNSLAVIGNIKQLTTPLGGSVLFSEIIRDIVL